MHRQTIHELHIHQHDRITNIMCKAGCLNNCTDIGIQTGNSSFIFSAASIPMEYKKPQGSELNEYGYRHAGVNLSFTV